MKGITVFICCLTIFVVGLVAVNEITAKRSDVLVTTWNSDQFTLTNFKIVGAMRQMVTVNSFTKISIPGMTDSLPDYFIHVKYDSIAPTVLKQTKSTRTTIFGTTTKSTFDLIIHQDSLLVALAH